MDQLMTRQNASLASENSSSGLIEEQPIKWNTPSAPLLTSNLRSRNTIPANRTATTIASLLQSPGGTSRTRSEKLLPLTPSIKTTQETPKISKLFEAPANPYLSSPPQSTQKNKLSEVGTEKLANTSRKENSQSTSLNRARVDNMTTLGSFNQINKSDIISASKRQISKSRVSAVKNGSKVYSDFIDLLSDDSEEETKNASLKSLSGDKKYESSRLQPTATRSQTRAEGGFKLLNDTKLSDGKKERERLQSDELNLNEYDLVDIDHIEVKPLSIGQDEIQSKTTSKMMRSSLQNLHLPSPGDNLLTNKKEISSNMLEEISADFNNVNSTSITLPPEYKCLLGIPNNTDDTSECLIPMDPRACKDAIMLRKNSQSLQNTPSTNDSKLLKQRGVFKVKSGNIRCFDNINDSSFLSHNIHPNVEVNTINKPLKIQHPSKLENKTDNIQDSITDVQKAIIRLNTNSQITFKPIDNRRSLASDEIIVIDDDININEDNMTAAKTKELSRKDELKCLPLPVSNIPKSTTVHQLYENIYMCDKTPWDMFAQTQNISGPSNKQIQQQDSVSKSRTNSNINESNNRFIKELDFDFDFDFDQSTSQTSLSELYNGVDGIVEMHSFDNEELNSLIECGSLETSTPSVTGIPILQGVISDVKSQINSDNLSNPDIIEISSDEEKTTYIPKEHPLNVKPIQTQQNEMEFYKLSGSPSSSGSPTIPEIRSSKQDQDDAATIIPKDTSIAKTVIPILTHPEHRTTTAKYASETIFNKHIFTDNNVGKTLTVPLALLNTNEITLQKIHQNNFVNQKVIQLSNDQTQIQWVNTAQLSKPPPKKRGRKLRIDEPRKPNRNGLEGKLYMDQLMTRQNASLASENSSSGLIEEQPIKWNTPSAPLLTSNLRSRNTIPANRTATTIASLLQSPGGTSRTRSEKLLPLTPSIKTTQETPKISKLFEAPANPYLSSPPQSTQKNKLSEVGTEKLANTSRKENSQSTSLNRARVDNMTTLGSFNQINKSDIISASKRQISKSRVSAVKNGSKVYSDFIDLLSDDSEEETKNASLKSLSGDKKYESSRLQPTATRSQTRAEGGFKLLNDTKLSDGKKERERLQSDELNLNEYDLVDIDHIEVKPLSIGQDEIQSKTTSKMMRSSLQNLHLPSPGDNLLTNKKEISSNMLEEISADFNNVNSTSITLPPEYKCLLGIPNNTDDTSECLIPMDPRACKDAIMLRKNSQSLQNTPSTNDSKLLKQRGVFKVKSGNIRCFDNINDSSFLSHNIHPNVEVNTINKPLKIQHPSKLENKTDNIQDSITDVQKAIIRLNTNSQITFKPIDNRRSLASDEIIVIDDDININEDNMTAAKTKELSRKDELKCLPLPVSNIPKSTTVHQLYENIYMCDKTPWDMFAQTQNISGPSNKQIQQQDSVSKSRTNSNINESNNRFIKELDFDFDFDFDQSTSQTSLSELYNGVDGIVEMHSFDNEELNSLIECGSLETSTPSVTGIPILQGVISDVKSQINSDNLSNPDIIEISSDEEKTTYIPKEHPLNVKPIQTQQNEMEFYKLSGSPSSSGSPTIPEIRSSKQDQDDAATIIPKDTSIAKTVIPILTHPEHRTTTAKYASETIFNKHIFTDNNVDKTLTVPLALLNTNEITLQKIHQNNFVNQKVIQLSNDQTQIQWVNTAQLSKPPPKKRGLQVQRACIEFQSHTNENQSKEDNTVEIQRSKEAVVQKSKEVEKQNSEEITSPKDNEVEMRRGNAAVVLERIEIDRVRIVEEVETKKPQEVESSEVKMITRTRGLKAEEMLKETNVSRYVSTKLRPQIKFSGSPSSSASPTIEDNSSIPSDEYKKPTNNTDDLSKQNSSSNLIYDNKNNRDLNIDSSVIARKENLSREVIDIPRTRTRSSSFKQRTSSETRFSKQDQDDGAAIITKEVAGAKTIIPISTQPEHRTTRAKSPPKTIFNKHIFTDNNIGKTLIIPVARLNTNEIPLHKIHQRSANNFVKQKEIKPSNEPTQNQCVTAQLDKPLPKKRGRKRRIDKLQEPYSNNKTTPQNVAKMNTLKKNVEAPVFRTRRSGLRGCKYNSTNKTTSYTRSRSTTDQPLEEDKSNEPTQNQCVTAQLDKPLPKKRGRKRRIDKLQEPYRCFTSSKQDQDDGAAIITKEVAGAKTIVPISTQPEHRTTRAKSPPKTIFNKHIFIDNNVGKTLIIPVARLNTNEIPLHKMHQRSASNFVKQKEIKPSNEQTQKQCVTAQLDKPPPKKRGRKRRIDELQEPYRCFTSVNKNQYKSHKKIKREDVKRKIREDNERKKNDEEIDEQRTYYLKLEGVSEKDFEDFYFEKLN